MIAVHESVELAPQAKLTAKPVPDDLGIDPGAQEWHRSGEGGGCIEIAFPPPPDPEDWEPGDWVLMRVSDDSDCRVLLFTRNEWLCFLDGVRKHEFDDAAAKTAGAACPPRPDAGDTPVSPRNPKENERS